MKDKIEVNDEVMVTWADGSIMYGVVLHIPSDVGDAWRVRDTDGTLRYIQQYETITWTPPQGE